MTSEIINEAASVWFMPCMRLLVYLSIYLSLSLSTVQKWQNYRWRIINWLYIIARSTSIRHIAEHQSLNITRVTLLICKVPQQASAQDNVIVDDKPTFFVARSAMVYIQDKPSRFLRRRYPVSMVGSVAVELTMMICMHKASDPTQPRIAWLE